MLGNLPDSPTLISYAITLVVALSLHELAHALMADWLGDPTPRRMGRITLNPLAHLDPFGALMFVLVGFGWAKPVLTNPNNLRNGPRVGTAVVALAGPAMNLLLAILAALVFRLGLLELDFSTVGGILPSPSFFLATFLFSNVALAVFNLIPIGALDGMKVLRGVAPHAWDSVLDVLERWGMFLFLALVFLPGQNLLGLIVSGPANAIIRLLLGL
jgi:Zn-dependent protease